VTSPSAEQIRRKLDEAEKLRDWLLDRAPDSADHHTGRILRDLLYLLTATQGEIAQTERYYKAQMQATALYAKRAEQAEAERARFLRALRDIEEQASAHDGYWAAATARSAISTPALPTKQTHEVYHPEDPALLDALEEPATPARPTEEP